MMKHARTLSKNFTDAQIEKIVRLRRAGNTWQEIARKLNREWLLEHSFEVYRGIFRRFGDEIVTRIKNKREPHPHEDFTREALGDIVKIAKSKKKKKYFVTAVGAAADVHIKGFSAILSYCKKEDAELVLFPIPAHTRALSEQPDHYDPILKPYLKNFATEYVFNQNLKGLELRLNPQQVHPLTGIRRIRGRDHLSDDPEVKHLIKNSKKCSLIVAHTKQAMEAVATGNNSFPRILHSTGCITCPEYLRNRVGVIAAEDHRLGGLIVEVSGDEFFITQVQIDPVNGSFVDKYGQRFHANGKVTQERAEAFVMGDIHPGMESQETLQVWFDYWKVIRPRKIFLHDWFDGHSISHHLANKKITKARRPPHFRTLAAEIEKAREVLNLIKKNAPADAEIYLVASNHPEHLDRYLDEGRYLNDCDDNYDLGHRMVVDLLDGKNPLKERLDPENNFIWLDRNQDFYVEGTQCGSHGDLGAGGSRGSIKQNEDIYSSSMTAHTHTPGIYHDAYVVGHSSQDRHGYNNGASNWIKCSGTIFRGGHKQLVMDINGKWHF